MLIETRHWFNCFDKTFRVSDGFVHEIFYRVFADGSGPPESGFPTLQTISFSRQVPSTQSILPTKPFEPAVLSTRQVKPGLSSYAANPEEGAKSIAQLLDFAYQVVRAPLLTPTPAPVR